MLSLYDNQQANEKDAHNCNEKFLWSKVFLVFVCVCVCLCVCVCVCVCVCGLYLRIAVWSYMWLLMCVWWHMCRMAELRLFHEYILLIIMVWVFANGPGDRDSIPGKVIPKTQKMVLDAALLNTQHYKARIKGKVEPSRERSSALPYTLV